MSKDNNSNSGKDRDSERQRLLGLCHRLCNRSCVELKAAGAHEHIQHRSPHWSVEQKEEQFNQIDRGEFVPLTIALPLPARDGREGSDRGVCLFWERFRCQRCGRCCYTPGAGLFLEKEDFERIAKHIGKKKLKILCRYDKAQRAWILKQPCPFYNFSTQNCQIYDIRPATCTKYPLHPPQEEMPYNLAVDAFCPAARQLAKDTLGWWIICENNWARLLAKMRTLEHL